MGSLQARSDYLVAGFLAIMFGSQCEGMLAKSLQSKGHSKIGSPESQNSLP